MQRPVTLYSLRQKFCFLSVLLLGQRRALMKRGGAQRDIAYFNLKEQNCWLITCQTISSDAMVAVRGWCLG